MPLLSTASIEGGGANMETKILVSGEALSSGIDFLFSTDSYEQ